MVEKKKPRFELKGVDDLFTTQEVRDERKLPRIRELPIDQITDFPDHPYKVRDDEDMMDTGWIGDVIVDLCNAPKKKTRVMGDGCER